MSEFIDDYVDDDNYFPKKEKAEIEIPDFLTKPNIIQTEEEAKEQAILNNTPGNIDIEKQNHLAKLEAACQNWEPDEWEKIIIHAPSHWMTTELDRRLEIHEKFVTNNRANLELLASQKL